MSETHHDRDDCEQKSTVKPLLIAALLMGVIAAPVSWFLGSQIGKKVPDLLDGSQNQEQAKDDPHKGKEASSVILALAPILTNLHEEQNVWVKMDIALVVKAQETLEPEQQAEISSDFIALLRQMTSAQIKGATGLMNLREDLLERARIRSEDKISALLISSLVIQ